jgi:colanic acid biosynthesis glycosyl transferase WcaI
MAHGRREPPPPAEELRADGRLNILILTHYFPPELGAPQSRLGFLTKFLVRRGHRVQVLTSFPSYPSGDVPPQYRGRVRVREEWEGARVIRTWTYARPGHSVFRRLLNHLSFGASCLLALFSLIRPDVILVESPPVFLPLSGGLLRLARRSKLVIHLADLWVTAAVKLGYLKPRSLARRGLEAIERIGYCFANAVIVVSRGMIPDVSSKGYPERNVLVIPNGVDTDVFYPRRAGDSVRTELKLEGKFVALYAGTHGLVTDMRIFIEVARMLAAHAAIHLLFVGDGVEKAKLVNAARDGRLTNMTFLDPQPESRLAEIVNACDIGLSTLKPVEFTDHVIPVKMFLYMACGIPVVATDKEAVRAILADAGTGVLVPQGDPGALRDAILELYLDPERRATLGAAGARFVVQSYSRRIAAQKTESLFLDLVAR